MSEDFSQYGKGGAKAVLLHVGAVDGAKLAAAQQSGTKLPGVHTPFWSPMVEPTLKTSIRVETAELLELIGTK